MGRERGTSVTGRPAGSAAVRFMAFAGRCSLILALTSFYWIYFNAWRYLFLPMLYPPPTPDLATAPDVDEAEASLDPSATSPSLVASLLLILALHFPLGMFGWAYYLTSTGGPGYVPKDWNPELEDAQVGKQVLWCSACSSFRPERAHHCRYCQRCVLMMDHHCPWIQNCVGYNNIKSFFLFLFYGILSCSSFFYLFYNRYQEISLLNEYLQSTADANESIDGSAPKQDMYGVWTSLVLLGLYIFFMLFLLNDHIRLITRNKTFIDYLKVYSNPLLAKMAMSWGNKFSRRHKRADDDDDRYDLGAIANAKYFLGDSFLMWFWPTTPRGTGFSFPTRRGRSDDDFAYGIPGESYDLRRR